MELHELAAHDEALVAAATAERPVVVPPVHLTGDQVVAKRVTEVATRVYFFTNNILSIWKDERNQWSTRRILLWVWTFLGFWAIVREVTGRVYVIRETIIQPHPLNNAWIQAWMVTEGAFIVAVFGPVMIDYFKNAAPAVTAIGSALRDRVIEPVRRDPRLPSITDDERHDG